MSPFCGARIILNWSKLALATVILFILIHLLLSHNVLFSTKTHKNCENAQGYDKCADDTTSSTVLSPPPPASQSTQRLESGFIFAHKSQTFNKYYLLLHRSAKESSTAITVAITVCGSSSMSQGLNALKSALVMSSPSTALHFVIMTDQHQMKDISEKVSRQISLFAQRLSKLSPLNRWIS